jgi:hypothetical protein
MVGLNDAQLVWLRRRSHDDRPRVAGIPGAYDLSRVREIKPGNITGVGYDGLIALPLVGKREKT